MTLNYSIKELRKRHILMKKSVLLFLLFSNFFCFAQYTLIPDSNFEKALIDLGIDTGAIDGKVLTARVSGVPQLDVTSKNITDLTGIQDFLALSGLHCMDNALTNLDISKYCFNCNKL